MSICAISGEACEEPVVSIKSGHVFEKRIILKWLETNDQKDPFSEGILTLEDLIPLKVNKVVKPRPPTATSIPSMLQLFQNEWDALMLETYSLKEQLDSVRQELSHALYQHDAACRVIARLSKERDEARNALANVKTNAPEQQVHEDGMEVETGSSGLTEEVKAKLTSTSLVLSKDRKNRANPPELATEEDIKSYGPVTSNNVHKTSPAGVICIDLHPNEDFILTGGADSQAVLFNRKAGKVSATLTGHTKAVTDVLFHPTQDLIFTTSKDKTAKMWSPAEKGYKSTHTVTVHEAEVTGASMHATQAYWATCSLDSSWAFHDISTSNVLVRVNGGSPCSCIAFHPDGLILGTGTTDSVLRIWDVKTQKNVATFEGHTGSVSSISFSENGYYLASAAQNEVKLWDLRKLKNFQSVTLEEGDVVNSVEWDYSGTYLAVASNDIKIFLGKNLSPVTTLSQHTKVVTGVKWGHHAKVLVSCSMDRSIKSFGKK